MKILLLLQDAVYPQRLDRVMSCILEDPAVSQDDIETLIWLEEDDELHDALARYYYPTTAVDERVAHEMNMEFVSNHGALLNGATPWNACLRMVERLADSRRLYTGRVREHLEQTEHEYDVVIVGAFPHEPRVSMLPSVFHLVDMVHEQCPNAMRVGLEFRDGTIPTFAYFHCWSSFGLSAVVIGGLDAIWSDGYQHGSGLRDLQVIEPGSDVRGDHGVVSKTRLKTLSQLVEHYQQHPRNVDTFSGWAFAGAA